MVQVMGWCSCVVSCHLTGPSDAALPTEAKLPYVTGLTIVKRNTELALSKMATVTFSWKRISFSTYIIMVCSYRPWFSAVVSGV